MSKTKAKDLKFGEEFISLTFYGIIHGFRVIDPFPIDSMIVYIDVERADSYQYMSEQEDVYTGGRK